MSKSALIRRADALYRSGKSDEAIESLRSMLAEDPSDTAVQKRLVGFLVDTDRKDVAISLLVKVQERLASDGDLLGAIAAGLKVVELDPSFENPLAYVARVKVESLQEDFKRETAAARTVRVPHITPLDDIPLLKDLKPEELSMVAAGMRRHELQEGQVVFTEGQEGESIYFVSRGLLDVLSSGNKLGRVQTGECFGEFSFLTQSPRTATVRAIEPTELLELSASSIQKVSVKYPRVRDVLFEMYRERALVNVLSQCPLFEMLPTKDRQRLAPRFELVSVAAGEAVFREGEEGGALYLVKQGAFEVRATVRGELINLAVLEPHQFFGEVSFLTGVPRTASVQAREDSELLRIEGEELSELLRHHPYMKDVLTRYHLDRVTATAETLKAFLKKERIDGILG